jgi:hypothetical protein
MVTAKNSMAAATCALPRARTITGSAFGAGVGERGGTNFISEQDRRLCIEVKALAVHRSPHATARLLSFNQSVDFLKARIYIQPHG